MQIRIKNELLLINICSLLLILVIWLLPNIQVLRIILGLPFLLYFPGYLLILALFPQRDSLQSFERYVLPFGLSVVIVPLLGFILNYAWKIDLWSFLITILVFMAIVSVIAWYERHKIPEAERFHVTFPIGKLNNRSIADRAFLVLIVILVLVVSVLLIVAVVSNKEGEKYTEFYMLGPEHKAEDYPLETVVGKEETVTLGIINNEGKRQSYSIRISLEGIPQNEIVPIILGDGELWEEDVSFTAYEASCITELVEPEFCGTQVFNPDCQTIKVESTEHLKLGDCIWVGTVSFESLRDKQVRSRKEPVYVREIEGNDIILEDILRRGHPAGDLVRESIKVEFKLFKLRDLHESDDEKRSLLSLWLGETSLDAEITNFGIDTATYDIVVTLTGLNNGKTSTTSIEAIELEPEKQWSSNLDYVLPPEPDWWKIEFDLYRNGENLYHEKISDGYPQLYLWLHVTEDSQAAEAEVE